MSKETKWKGKLEANAAWFRNCPGTTRRAVYSTRTKRPRPCPARSLKDSGTARYGGAAPFLAGAATANFPERDFTGFLVDRAQVNNARFRQLDDGPNSG